MGTYTKNLKLETPNYTDNADIPALTKKNNEIIDSEMIKRANGLDYNEQTGVLQLTGNNSKVGSPIQIKNNLPVTSMSSGTELKVNNYKQLIKFTKEGKTEQKTYTGKNLFYDTPSSTTSNGITLTKNSDGSFTLNGTSTNVSVFNFTLPKVLLAGTYTFSIKGSDNIPGDVFLRARDNNWAMVETQSQVNGNNTTQNSHTFTCKKDISIVAINITRAGITFNNFVIYPQLEKGTTATKFEPYVGATPSPNPDYPQEIENISGVENLLNIPDGTYESNGITAIAKGGVVTLNGTATANSFISIPFNYTFLANINYTLSANNTLTMVGENYIRFNYGTTVYFPCRFSYEKSKFTNNFNENTIVNVFTIRTESGKTYNNFVIKPMLVEGSTSHNFVLPGTNYLQLNNKNGNVFKVINIDMKGNKLCSNNDKTIKDDLIIENGRAKIYKKYGEYAFTGNESFAFTDNNKRINTDSDRISKLSNVYIPNPSTSKNITPLFCTHYSGDSQTNVIKGSNKIGFSQWNGKKMIYFPADYDTIDEFKAKLKSLYDAGTPVIIQYPLSEPEGVDLGEIDFDLIENSTLTCEEESDMQIDYLTIDSNIFVQDSLDGNSSQKAPSVDAIKKYFGKKVYDKDANGWIKIEFFDHTEYVTEGQITQIDFSTGWGVSKLLSLPVGMSTIGDRILSGNVRTFDAAISVNISGILTETQITYNWKNNHSSNVTTGLNYSLRILEYV